MSIKKLPQRKRRFTRLQMVILAVLACLLVGLITAVLVVATYDYSDLTNAMQQRREAAGQTAVYEFDLTLTP